MSPAGAIELQCGHRFDFAHLNVARRGAQVCHAAGLTSKDTLICPLCGDQDNTSKPGANHMLTSYSRDSAAYLGDLRKDWQKSLALPFYDKGDKSGRHRTRYEFRRSWCR